MKNIRIKRLRARFVVVALASCGACHLQAGDAGEAVHAHEGEHGEHSSHAHEHGHDHGDEVLGVTRWSDKLELYAEYSPAVAGQPLKFLAHLTILEGFRALDNAAVTLVLDGPTHVEAQVTENLRPGIFQPTLKAPSAGTYQGSLVIKGPAVEGTLDGFEVVVYPNTEAAKRAVRKAEENNTGATRIRFLKEQQWQVPFGTAFATIGMVVPTIEVAGEVTTPPSGQADVSAAIAGRVVAPSAGLPRPGQAVRRGELLATIAPAPSAPEAGARADLAVVEAEARVQSARAAVERAERLIADRAISQRQLDDARRDLRVAEEAVQTAHKARDMFSGATSGRGAGIYRVMAPISGVVVAIDATSGQSVQAGSPMFRVVNLDELWIRARVPEQQAALIRADQNAAYKFPGLDMWLPLDVTGEDASAAVINVGRTVDRRSRTVDVIYGLRAPDERLRVGAMLHVAVPVGQPWTGVVVPRGGVLDDDGRSVVYVQVEGEAFEERTVRRGPQSGMRVGIVDGIREGERVVILGANVIRLSSRAATAPAHGHVH